MKTLKFNDTDMRETIQFAVASGFKVKRYKYCIRLFKDNHDFAVETIYTNTYKAVTAIKNIKAIFKSF